MSFLGDFPIPHLPFPFLVSELSSLFFNDERPFILPPSPSTAANPHSSFPRSLTFLSFHHHHNRCYNLTPFSSSQPPQSFLVHADPPPTPRHPTFFNGFSGPLSESHILPSTSPYPSPTTTRTPSPLSLSPPAELLSLRDTSSPLFFFSFHFVVTLGLSSFPVSSQLYPHYYLPYPHLFF